MLKILTSPQGRYIQSSDGRLLYVEVKGDPNRIPILFLHGGFQCHLSWEPQFTSFLSKEYYLVRMDMRGCGLSDKPQDVAAYHHKQMADDMQSIIEQLRLDRPFICAWSYGVFVLGHYGHHYGFQQVRGLITGGSVLGMNMDIYPALLTPEMEQARRKSISPLAEDLLESMVGFVSQLTYRPMPVGDYFRVLGYSLVAPHAARVAATSPFDYDARQVLAQLQQLHVPVLITQGMHDSLCPPAVADGFAAVYPYSHVELFDESGHSPHYEESGHYNQVLAQFARQVISEDV